MFHQPRSTIHQAQRNKVFKLWTTHCSKRLPTLSRMISRRLIRREHPAVADRAPLCGIRRRRSPNTSGQGKWQELDDVFWTVIPFGTGGRRGSMYPIGSNAINDRTIGEERPGAGRLCSNRDQPRRASSPARSPTTRGIARGTLPSCAPRSWWRPGSRSFSWTAIAARRSCRSWCGYKQCSCGIMVTASHNPPSDNAVKVYWSTGGQMLPPHDKGIIDCVMSVAGDRPRADFDEARGRRADRPVCQEEVDAAYQRGRADARLRPGRGSLKVIYSPLHGVGESAVLPVLTADGFTDVEAVWPARQAGRRFSQRARPRRQSRESGGVRRDHRARKADRRRSDRWRPIRIATASAGRAADRSASDVAVAHAHRQSDRRTAGRLCARNARKRAGSSRRSITS